MASDEFITQAEKRRIIREQASTMHAHATAAAADEAGGRHQSSVVGSGAIPQYPAGPAWSAAEAMIPPEPPTGYDINEMLPIGGPPEVTPLEPPPSAQDPGDLAAASPGLKHDAGVELVFQFCCARTTEVITLARISSRLSMN